MKKAILLIAAALLFCGQMKAQEMADAFNSNSYSLSQYSLMDNSQTQVSSIYDLSMPPSDLGVNNEFANQEYASRKGWGIVCIVAGGSALLGGVAMLLMGGLINSASSQIGDMSGDMGFGDDPDFQQDFQQGQDMAQAAGGVVQTIGIVGSVVGAGLVGTGIWLVSSDGGSSSRRGHGRRGGHRRHRRYSENMPTIEPIEPDWALSFNVGPASTGLTLAF